MNILFLSLYRYLLVPTAAVALPIAALFNRKIREGMNLRRIRHEPLPPGNDPIWIHAASGEFEYAKAVIRELKASSPSTPIIVTYFSPTFAKGVASFPGVDRAVALPLDLAAPCRSFLKQMHPKLLLIARTDLWPEILDQCRKRKIPVVIFSYTQKAFRSSFKKYFTRWTLQWIERVYCVAEADREHLAPLQLKKPVEVMGDTRYDQVAYRLMNPKPIAANLHPKGDAPVLVAGSTWAEDEAVLLPALEPHLKNQKLKLILVPHEPTPEHIQSLKKQFAKLGLTHTLFSSGNWNHENILLVDKVGVLAELYLWGQFAFVGGSFKKSVHSVMEALGAGCVTFVGPYYENNREAVQFHALKFGSMNGVEVVKYADELSEHLALLLAQPEMTAKFSDSLKKEFASRLGASRRLAGSLKDLISPPAL